MTAATMDIKDAEIVEETTSSGHLHDGTLDSLANWIDEAVEGNRGRAFTYGVRVSGYARNGKALQDVYNNNREVIEQYFSNIDTAKLLSKVGEEKMKEARDSVKSNWPTYVGIGAGVIAAIYILK